MKNFIRGSIPDLINESGIKISRQAVHLRLKKGMSLKEATQTKRLKCGRKKKNKIN